MKLVIAFGLIQFLFAPSFLSAASNRKRAQEGTWGGLHIEMNVTRNGATLRYDCAEGSIDEPLVLDRRGQFKARGKHKASHPGPIRENEADNSVAAIYTGKVVGNRMTLTVRLANSNETVDTFELVFGQGGRIRRCL